MFGGIPVEGLRCVRKARPVLYTLEIEEDRPAFVVADESLLVHGKHLRRGIVLRLEVANHLPTTSGIFRKATLVVVTVVSEGKI